MKRLVAMGAFALWAVHSVAGGAAPAAAAIAVTSTSSSSSPSTNMLTYSHTIVAGSDRFLAVGVSAAGSGPSGATYNGIAMANFVGGGSSSQSINIYILVDPPVGVANVVVSTGSPVAIVSGAVSFSGVDQSSPTGGTAFQGSLSQLNITTLPDDMAIAVIGGLADVGSFAPDGSQVEQYNLSTGGMSTDVVGALSTKAATGGTTTIEWTVANPTASINTGGFAINPAIATPTVTHTGTVTNTATATATATQTGTATHTGTATATATETGTATATDTATATPTATATGTVTSTATATPLRPDGAGCDSGTQCLSTFCVDGVCCATACTLPNQRCDLGGREGVCVDTAPAPTASPPTLALALAGLSAIAFAALRARRRTRAAG